MSLQETEIDRFQAPEEAAAEEDKLRVEREEKEKQQIKVSICSCYANLAAKFGTQRIRSGVTVLIKLIHSTFEPYNASSIILS